MCACLNTVQDIGLMLLMLSDRIIASALISVFKIMQLIVSIRVNINFAGSDGDYFSCQVYTEIIGGIIGSFCLLWQLLVLWRRNF